MAAGLEILPAPYPFPEQIGEIEDQILDTQALFWLPKHRQQQQ